jgi:uncharacterized membrane protein YgdD (TMEM256/DUF423 family)
MVWIVVSAVSGALAVMLGAFGAHGLVSRVSSDQLATWSTATHYHQLHSVVLLALSLYAARSGREILLPASLLTAGIVLFSGSLYVLVVTGQGWLGALTPVGGLCTIAGWLALLTLARS